MNKMLIWDIPTRVFHWAFASCISAALGIGFLVDDDDPLFRLHMVFGIIAIFLLAVRLLLGFVGSRYARFASYPLRPREVAAYLGAAVLSKPRRYAGNNPGSALAAVLMFVLVPMLFVTGGGLTGGESGEIHESLAWALLAVVLLHLAGIAWHTIRHRENIGLAMITGKKDGEPADAISSPHYGLGLGFLILAAAWTLALFANHDSHAAKLKLPVLGVTVNLGENEAEEHSPSRHGKHVRERHEDDD
jgi:cytochrome b